jgi:guanylate kinase
MEELRGRLERRGTDSKEVIERRLADAESEMAKKHIYRHVVVNDDLEKTIHRLDGIVKKYRQNR